MSPRVVFYLSVNLLNGVLGSISCSTTLCLLSSVSSTLSLLEDAAVRESDALSSLRELNTLNSAVSPAFKVVPSSLTAWRAGQKPSMFSPSDTTTPFSVTSVTVPSWMLSTPNWLSKPFQGFSSSCLWPSERRRFSLLISRTTTSRLAPTCVNSDGCLTFLVHERSEMCTRPSMPSSISTNTPKLEKLRTRAVHFVPAGYLFSISPMGRE